MVLAIKKKLFFFQTHVAGKLWIAPEHLRQSECLTSREGDVYSFGIIVYEIVSRQEPYENELDNLELCGKIISLKICRC